ncbi:hypothetical protein ARO37_07145, partial [Listeria monocytogenes]|nr:hypothetical protein [Listeria monocytogenes]
ELLVVKINIKNCKLIKTTKVSIRCSSIISIDGMIVPIRKASISPFFLMILSFLLMVKNRFTPLLSLYLLFKFFFKNNIILIVMIKKLAKNK